MTNYLDLVKFITVSFLFSAFLLLIAPWIAFLITRYWEWCKEIQNRGDR